MNRRDIDAVYKRGRRARSDGISISVLDRGDSDATRVGFAVGRRCGGAVVRNRIRRRLRAAATALPAGLDVVIGGSPGLERTQFQELESHVKRALSRAIAS